ncbi:MAG: DUF1569 domain-containing protein [Planctomycetota bacterium]
MSQMKRRLNLRFKTLRDASYDVRQLIDGGYELTGNWSLAQILKHLNLTMEMMHERPDFHYPFFLRPILKLVMLPMMRRGKPIRMRASVPVSLAPQEEEDLGTVSHRFHELVDQLTDPKTEFQPFHPLLGNLNREQWLVMQTWHATHHLSFAVPKQN